MQKSLLQKLHSIFGLSATSKFASKAKKKTADTSHHIPGTFKIVPGITDDLSGRFNERSNYSDITIGWSHLLDSISVCNIACFEKE